MSRCVCTILAFVALPALVFAAAAGAQSGQAPAGPASSPLREITAGQVMTNEIARIYYWQTEEELIVKGWLMEKMGHEESIFVKIRPMFGNKKQKVKAKQLFPAMRKRKPIDLTYPPAEELKVDARYATTGGRIQEGKTSFSERFDMPPPGKAMLVLCQRTSGLENCRCDAQLLESLPTSDLLPPSGS